jgi:hypothetical protein
MVDTLFDEVSRILAQPRPRRATLRLMIGITAGAAVGTWFPKSAFAWAPIPCGNTTCSPDQGLMCCNASTSTCCTSGGCLNDFHNQTTKVCCSSGKACVGLCCGTLETCCGGACCETISASTSVPPKMTCSVSGTGASVCAKVSTCDSTACGATPGFACVNGKCQCDPATCAATGGACNSSGVCKCDANACAALSTIEFTLACNATTGTCVPIA